MNNERRTRSHNSVHRNAATKVFILITVLISFVFQVRTQALAQTNNLFVPTSAQELSVAQQNVVDSIKKEKGAIRVEIVRINVQALSQDSLMANVLP
jgi:hypothetical protein